MISSFFLMRWRKVPVLAIFSLLVAVAAAPDALPAHPRLAGSGAGVNQQNVPAAIVIGFVGGMVRHDDQVHTEVQIAADLRRRYPEGVFIATFENRRLADARKAILAALDADHDGSLSESERRNAHIILYGHSWGAAAVVSLARDLEREGIPVLLTVQVDSVAKAGQNDALIPGNVAAAVNFYQPNGWLHGQPQIQAANPSRTRILGNFRSEYKTTPYTCQGYPWFGRIFAPEHIKIECDIHLWSKIEDLICQQLPTKMRAQN